MIKKTKELKIGFILDLHGRGNNPIARMDDYPQALLDKVEFVCNENDIIIFAGDVLNSTSTSIKFLNKLLLILTKHEAQGKIIKIMLGNHDISGRVYDTYLDCSIGSMLIGRDWLLHTDIYSPCKYLRIIPLTFTSTGEPYIPKFQKDDAYNILVGHAYFNHPEFNDEWNIDGNLLQGFNYCILGHDHTQYPIEQYHECVLLRSGSISRGTIEEKDLEVKYPQLRLYFEDDNKPYVSAGYKDIPYKDSETVFKFIDNTNKELKKHKQDIEKMIELLKVEDIDESKLTVPKVLKEIECPEKYINIIREVLNG